MKDEPSAAFLEGKNAYHEGCLLSDNPYFEEESPEECLDWEAGWMDSEEED